MLFLRECGTFQKDCTVNLTQKSQGSKCDLLYIENSMVEESKNNWVFDSGFTKDVCVSFRGLKETRSLLDRSFTLWTSMKF